MKAVTGLALVGWLGATTTPAFGEAQSPALETPQAETTPALQDSGPKINFNQELPHTSQSNAATRKKEYVSPWLTDVIKLAQARIDPAVILTFIDSAGTFNLTPD